MSRWGLKNISHVVWWVVNCQTHKQILLLHGVDTSIWLTKRQTLILWFCRIDLRILQISWCRDFDDFSWPFGHENLDFVRVTFWDPNTTKICDLSRYYGDQISGSQRDTFMNLLTSSICHKRRLLGILRNLTFWWPFGQEILGLLEILIWEVETAPRSAVLIPHFKRLVSGSTRRTRLSYFSISMVLDLHLELGDFHDVTSCSRRTRFSYPQFKCSRHVASNYFITSWFG